MKRYPNREGVQLTTQHEILAEIKAHEERKDRVLVLALPNDHPCMRDFMTACGRHRVAIKGGRFARFAIRVNDVQLPVAMMTIPKADLSAETLDAMLKEVTGEGLLDPGRDVVTFTSHLGEMMALAAFLEQSVNGPDTGSMDN